MYLFKRSKRLTIRDFIFDSSPGALQKVSAGTFHEEWTRSLPIVRERVGGGVIACERAKAN
jgi:hypothetical protein